jgi:hypothetical protein
VRDLIIAVPLWVIVAVLLIFFSAVIFAARRLTLRRLSNDTRRDFVDQANNPGYLDALAATFALFVGFAMTVTWGAVATGQDAVELHATSIQQMAWRLDNIGNRAEAAALMDKLSGYATAAATADDPFLIRGNTTNLPSTVLLDSFEDAVHRYAFGRSAAPQEVDSLVTGAETVSANAASVAAVAKRDLPGVVVILLMVCGVIVAVVLGIMTASSRLPVVMYLWAVVPALSITVVLALAFPFAHGTGVDLAPLQAVAEKLAAR